MKKIIALVFAVATLSAFTYYAATTVPIRQAGPYYVSQIPFDSTNINGVGGVVKVYLMDTVTATDTGKIGRVVLISRKNTVKADTVARNYKAIAGVICGGAQTSMQCSTAVADTNAVAAFPGQRVLVIERGRYWTLVDSGAGFSPGSMVWASTRSNQRGRITNFPGTAIDTLYRVFGKVVDTAITGKAVLTEIRVR